MMKKMLFLMLFLMIIGAVNLNSQVRIGGSIKPQAAAVLDLNVDSTATPANKGALALPRVNLTSETMTLNGGTPANGMLIYNTGSAFPVGVYVWITNKWVKADFNPLKITVQPKSFSWSRLKETYGDPNGPATVTTIAPLTVTATGSGTLTYAWYEKPKNQNVTARGTKLASAATYTPPVTAWGMHTYYCVVSNGTDSVVSNYADVAIGCGAKTMDGRWLSFMCYNLGADPSLDPFTYTSLGDTTSFDSKGWLFQWGRVADGHQWRSSATVAGPVYLPTQGQIPATGTSGTSTSLGITAAQTYSNFYGKFITASGYEYFYDWRTPQACSLWYATRSAHDPCPEGWQLPTQSAFAYILSDNTFGRQAPADATANTWNWTPGGYQLMPDAITTTLFLPAAGAKNDGAGFIGVGTTSTYWTCTAYSNVAVGLGGNADVVGAQSSSERAYARSVRCVAKN